MSEAKQIGNLDNAMAMLRASPLLADAFATDLMQAAVILEKPLPARGADEPENDDDLPAS